LLPHPVPLPMGEGTHGVMVRPAQPVAALLPQSCRCSPTPNPVPSSTSPPHPSPPGRRWPEGPDEGTAPQTRSGDNLPSPGRASPCANHRRALPFDPHPVPLPTGEGTHGVVARPAKPAAALVRSLPPLFTAIHPSNSLMVRSPRSGRLEPRRTAMEVSSDLPSTLHRPPASFETRAAPTPQHEGVEGDRSGQEGGSPSCTGLLRPSRRGLRPLLGMRTLRMAGGGL